MRPFACPQNLLSSDQRPLSQSIPYPDGEQNGWRGREREKLGKTHVLGSQQVWNLHWVSHGREFRWCTPSAVIVTKNSSGNHLEFPGSFWGVSNQIIWNVPVSRVTDSPLWLCNSQTLDRAIESRGALCSISFMVLHLGAVTRSCP